MTTAPRGRLTGRFLKALAVAKGNFAGAAAYASAQRWIESETIAATCKAAVGAMGQTDQPELFRAIAQDLAAVVAPLSIVGRLSGFRRIPPMTALVTQVGGAVGYWGDQFQSDGAGAPVSALAFSRFAGLAARRVTALAVVANELARSGTPDTDVTIATDLGRALGVALDTAFLNPLSSGSPSTSPASVTSTGRIFASTGASVTAIDDDLEMLVRAVHDGGSDLANATWVMNTLTAVRLAKLRSSGALAYPNVTARGGVLMGLPVLTSANIARFGSPSPGTTYLSLVDPSRIWLTSGDDAEFSASEQALIEQLDAPTQDASSGTAANQVSMFQTESVALKAVRRVGWQPTAGTSHAATLINVEY